MPWAGVGMPACWPWGWHGGMAAVEARHLGGRGLVICGGLQALWSPRWAAGVAAEPGDGGEGGRLFRRRGPAHAQIRKLVKCPLKVHFAPFTSHDPGFAPPAISLTQQPAPTAPSSPLCSRLSRFPLSLLSAVSSSHPAALYSTGCTAGWYHPVITARPSCCPGASWPAARRPARRTAPVPPPAPPSARRAPPPAAGCKRRRRPPVRRKPARCRRRRVRRPPPRGLRRWRGGGRGWREAGPLVSPLPHPTPRTHTLAHASTRVPVLGTWLPARLPRSPRLSA